MTRAAAVTTPNFPRRTQFCIHELETFFSANFVLVNAGALAPTILAKRYRLTNKFLGQGAFGVVVEAEDLALNRRVALKIMPAAHHDGTAVLEHGEATNLAHLQHPNIIDIYDLTMFSLRTPEEELVCACMVLPVINAPNLREWVFREEPDQQRKLAMLEKIGRAIEYAHEHGVIHGDLKPEHILVQEDDTPVLIDFGLSLQSGRPRHLMPASQTQSLAARTSEKRRGTAAYMAPEAFHGASSRESDRFSFAMISWELLTGELPFDSEQFATSPETNVDTMTEGSMPSQVREALRKDLAFYESHRTSREHPIFAVMTASTLSFFEMLQVIAQAAISSLRRFQREIDRLLTIAEVPRLSSLPRHADALQPLDARGEPIAPSHNSARSRR